MLDVQRWGEIRRMKEVEGLSIHEIVRRTGHDRNTVRRALWTSPASPDSVELSRSYFLLLMGEGDTSCEAASAVLH